MKTIMARTPHDFSFSKRYFNWRKKGSSEECEEEDDDEEVLNSFSSSSQLYMDQGDTTTTITNNNTVRAHELLAKPVMPHVMMLPQASKKKFSIVSISKFRSALALFGNKHKSSLSLGLGSKVMGTLYGYRKGHVHFAFQEDPKSYPAFLIELATPTGSLIREMASGLVRIALECDKNVGKKGVRLLEESLWRAYCNGKKCGFAMRRECGAAELKMLKALQPVTMGAGVLPGNIGETSSDECGEVMFMRARFERVVGSKDSEAFYMMNPDGSGGPELSIFLLRV
ncbi:hypothetical protein Scep_022398 [Stephania cephalantha]|uniref:Protein MIZU-KUSSEI 1 n=1 Tax=Stephania cephalantha TaxID=152367 RepID=A0AAP0I2N0_9MAGN